MDLERHARYTERAKGILRTNGIPESCNRCGAGPGDPSCGKVIHIELDSAWESAIAELDGEWPDTSDPDWRQR